MVLSFVYVILINGSLKHDTKATDGGGLDLSLCTRVLGKVEGNLVVSRGKRYCKGKRYNKGLLVEGNAKYYFFINYVDFEWVDSVFSQWCLNATYGKPSFICSGLLAPQFPGINMLKGWQLNFPLRL